MVEMNSLRSVGEMLHAARMERGISLEDLAAATRINLKFLKEIDEGVMPDVPKTYLRAFVKDFAERVGLDAEEVLRRFEPGADLPASSRVDAPAAPPAALIPKIPARISVPVNLSAASGSHKQLKPLLTLIVILLAVLIVVVLWLRNSRESRGVKEVSFGEVVQEQEARLPGMGAPPDSARQAAATKPEAVKLDSLDLQAVASESVWVRIVIDREAPREYMLTKFSHLHRKADSTFLISVGNAAGLALTLNGQKIDLNGKENVPVKNVLLTRETLKHLQAGAAKNAEGGG